MLFQVPPTPKQLKKLAGNTLQDFSVPQNWEDFAPLLTIRSGRGFQQFTPFPMQVELSEQIEIHSFTLIAKGRQLGISEFCLSKILHWALKQAGYSAVIVSRTLLDVYKLAARMIAMVESINVATVKKSSTEITFANGSRIVFCQPGDSSARGEASVNCIMLDEFSFLAEPELTLGSALPATSMVENPKVLLVFTPNGKSNYSYKLLN
jgi:hypothetical protein